MKTHVGIDIGSQSVKLVELKKNRSNATLLQAQQMLLADLPFYNPTGQISLEVVRWMINRYKIRDAFLTVSFPMDYIYSKYIQLPSTAEDKVQQMIPFEARQQIPFSLDEVYWDAYTLGKDMAANETHVALHAMKRKSIELFMGELLKSDVHVNTIDVDAMALYNAMAFNDQAKEAVLVDVGVNHTNVIVVDQYSCWTRNLPIGGHSFTAALTKDLGLTVEEAEKFKREVGLTAEVQDYRKSEVLQRAIQNLIKEVQRTMSYYRSLSKNVAMHQLYLSGPSVKIKGFTQLFAENFNIDVAYFDPFRNVQLGRKVDLQEVEEFRTHYACAVGLALRNMTFCKVRVNLLPQSVLDTQRVKGNRWYIWLWLPFLFVIMLSFSWLLFQRTIEIQDRIDKARQARQTFKKMDRQIQTLVKSIRPVEQKAEQLEALLRQRQTILDVLLALKGVTINDMFYPRVQWGFVEEDIRLWQQHQKGEKDGERIDVEGPLEANHVIVVGETSDTYKKADNLRTALIGQPLFEQVQILEAQEFFEEKRKKIRFKMKLHLREPST